MQVEPTASRTNVVEIRGKLTDIPLSDRERRRYPRVELNLSAYVNVAERSFCARCLSLSAGGALLKLDTSLDLPEEFLLHLVMPVLNDLPVPMIARREGSGKSAACPGSPRRRGRSSELVPGPPPKPRLHLSCRVDLQARRDIIRFGL